MLTKSRGVVVVVVLRETAFVIDGVRIWQEMLPWSLKKIPVYQDDFRNH